MPQSKMQQQRQNPSTLTDSKSKGNKNKVRDVANSSKMQKVLQGGMHGAGGGPSMPLEMINPENLEIDFKQVQISDG